MAERAARHKQPEAEGDLRTQAQRDRDRILYCSAFRRLSGVTQVVAVEEGDVYHNRLTHSLKVAQIARRIAERLINDSITHDLAEHLDISPDVAEAAGLAHDLGHPPFGHVGEHTLARCAKKVTANRESFEGNAQTFRILTRLTRRFLEIEGLNLTRATLASVLKYPWLYDSSDEKKSKKWGAYSSDRAMFEWATEKMLPNVRSVEAEIMDFSDDIAYSVHDLEDFIRAGTVPIALLNKSDELRKDVLTRVMGLPTWKDGQGLDSVERLDQCLKSVLNTLPAPLMNVPYRGTHLQRAAVRMFTSRLIGRYVDGVGLQVPSAPQTSFITIPPNISLEIQVLKQMTWLYAIETPALAAQQLGHANIIERTFNVLFEEARSKKRSLAFPARFEHLLPIRGEESETADQAARLTADCIASMTERELVAVHARLTGSDSGTFLNPIFR